MIKWLGYISTIILLQCLFLGIYLNIVGKFPSRELGLAWQAIFSTPGESSGTEASAEAPPPPELPSYEDLLQERLLASPEIARKIDEFSAVRRAVQDEQTKLESARSELTLILQKIEKKANDDIAQAQEQGEQKLLELLQTMKSKQAKEYLVSDPDQDRVLRMIIQMDPASAEKIFREFQQPTDQRTLNGWLDRLGKGDPEAQRLKKLLEETQKSTKS